MSASTTSSDSTTSPCSTSATSILVYDLIRKTQASIRLSKPLLTVARNDDFVLSLFYHWSCSSHVDVTASPLFRLQRRTSAHSLLINHEAALARVGLFFPLFCDLSILSFFVTTCLSGCIRVSGNRRCPTFASPWFLSTGRSRRVSVCTYSGVLSSIS